MGPAAGTGVIVASAALPTFAVDNRVSIFFVAKREKRGVAQTMSPGERETIAVRPHYQALIPRLWRTDPRWSEPENDPDPTVGPDVTINLGNRVAKIGKSKIFALL
jgi:hypothetical protein